MVYLLIAVLIAGGLVGFIIGFACRNRTFRWCVTCGGTVGSTCTECRDRQRATNIRTHLSPASLLAGQP